MIFNHELGKLTEDELGLLQYIITNKGSDESMLNIINSIRKEYIINYFVRNKQTFNQKGLEVAQSLITKLIGEQKSAAL